LATLNLGELFGEMAIVDGSRRMAHALAKEDSVFIEIPAAALEMRLKKVDPFLMALMNILVNNLRSVHQAYMKRARSINDYINAIKFHTQGFRLYLTRLDETQMSTEGLEKLAQIDVLVRDLRRSFKDHDDPRFSALREQDINHKK
jgi:CRP/FNR family cyclic AMP-dependent transcriptional regulator